MANQILTNSKGNPASIRHEPTAATSPFLLNNLSHHLNSPLNIIQGQTYLIRQVLKNEASQIHPRLDAISAAAKELTKVCTDVLEMMRANKSSRPPSMSCFEMRELMETLQTLSQDVPSDVHLSWDPSDSDYRAYVGDFELLKTLLQSLVEMVIKCSGSGKVAVSANRLKRHGDLESIHFSVTYQGPLTTLLCSFDTASHRVGLPYSPSLLVDSDLRSLRNLARLLDTEIECRDHQERGCSLSFIVSLKAHAA